VKRLLANLESEVGSNLESGDCRKTSVKRLLANLESEVGSHLESGGCRQTVGYCGRGRCWQPVPL
jgi:hypothetical protein